MYKFLNGLCFTGTNCAVFQYQSVSGHYGLISNTCVNPAKRVICELPAGT